MNILINGAGRIGRNFIRRLIFSKKHRLHQINDPFLTIENLAYLLNFDSIYGKFSHQVEIKGKYLTIGNKKILFSKDEDLLKRKIRNINLIIDSSGLKKNHNLLKKRKQKSIITHTYEKSDFQIIYGINEKEYNRKDHYIISSSICDAVAIGPVINLLDSNFDIINGSITTLHPWLSYQNLMDGPSRSYAYPGKLIENFALGRASTETLIPKRTSCVDALIKSMPSIKDKFISMSVRVPTQIVSSAIINLNFKDKINNTMILNIINNFINQQKTKIISLNKDQCVSKDFIANEYSCIIDERWLETKDKSLRLFVWYDNEYGYSSRVLDLIKNI